MMIYVVNNLIRIISVYLINNQNLNNCSNFNAWVINLHKLNNYLIIK